MKNILPVILLAGGAYLAWVLYQQYAAAQPVATGGSTGGGTPPPPPPPPPAPQTGSALTAAQLATTPFSAAQQAQFAALNTAVDQMLQAGQLPTIGGNSDLAYMLGWGGASKGASKSVYGITYQFDGSNWNMLGTLKIVNGVATYTKPSGVSGLGVMFVGPPAVRHGVHRGRVAVHHGVPVRRGPVTLPVRNYVPHGTPMRRVG